MDKEKIRRAAANGFSEIVVAEETGGLPNASELHIDVESIRADAQTLLSDTSVEKSTGLFVLKSANKWMEEAKLRPIPKMLFGEFWFEGEVCILFADTGAGKSILAVQIAESIASGRPFDNFIAIPPQQKVLYFDFELSEKQFEGRYAIEKGNYFTNHYQFNENFIRAQINPEICLDAEGGDFEGYLSSAMERSIIESGARIVIVDNLTYLLDEIEKARNALPLMKHLKALKSKYGLSLLVLAHTPKRDLTKPITKNDLHGSKMLINFCDSSFAIGESNKETEIRYLKQIKVRNAKFVYNTENVQLCHLVKPTNFLHFELGDFASEKEHLRDLSDIDRKEFIEQVKELAASGKSQREIATETGLSAATVNRYLKK
jgi:RecA-family ATPase